MTKKLFTTFFILLIAFLWTSAIAQDFRDVSPNLESKIYDHSQDAMWDVLLQFDATALTGAAGNAGCEWDGTYFYSTRWASNLIHKYDATGTTLIEQFSIPGVSGLRDLAFDGTYMYGGAATNTIYQMDFVTKTLIGTITSPVAVRFIAYDEGADAFWVGNWTDPPTLVSRTGATLASFTTGFAAQYGAAYDNVSPGGPYLWIFNQENVTGGIPQTISQWDISTGTATGVTHDVMTDVGIAAGNLSIAGGLFSMTDFASGFFTIGGLLQGNPNGDQIFVYEVEPINPTVSFFDNFDSYIAGQQLACQNPIDWTTWTLTPCDPQLDPYISTNHAYSGANSVVIIQNGTGNDCVKPLGTQTSGKWYISFLIYIPTGKSGYFNTMNDFYGTTQVWGHDCFFDVGGAGRLDITGGGGGGTIVNFNWTVDAWNQIMVVVDLDTHTAEFWIGTNPQNFTMVSSWDWTNGGAKPNTLDVNDFYGFAATDEMYIDNYYFGDAMPPIIPVELTSFTAIGNNGVVDLNWHTATEVNNHMFEIERKSAATEFSTIGYVEGHGTTTEPQNYSYTDNEVETGTYVYRLKQIDFNGTFAYSNEVEVNVTAPLTFNLEQNYPNPFNPSTRINYSVPETGNVRLSVYNVVGEEVAVLVNGYTQAGSFDVTFNASNLPSGVYLYKLQSANSVQTKKMMLLK